MLPPASPDAEQALIGALLLDNSLFRSVAEVIDEADFYYDNHRRIWRHVATMIRAGRLADVVTVADAIESACETDQAGGLAYLGELANSVVSARNAPAWARVVKEKARARSLQAAGHAIATLGTAPGEIEARIEQARALIDAVRGSARERPVAGGLSGFTPADMFCGWTPPRYLVKEFINCGELVVLFGDSGVLKTFVALDLSLHVALGRSWCGYRVSPAPVVYVCAEGAAGARKRLRAWLIAHGLDASSPMPQIIVIDQAVDMIGDPERLRLVIDAFSDACGEAVCMVVLDTLSANFGEGDESKTEDVHRVLKNVRHACGDASVLIVHHVGHADKGRERGAYALRAAADRRILVERPDPGDVIYVKPLKAKDEGLSSAISLRWRKVPLDWEDQDGDELTSLVLDPCDAPVRATPVAVLGHVQKAVMVAIKAAGGMTRKDVIQTLREQNVARRSIYDAIDALLRQGHIVEGFNKLVAVES